MYLNAVDVSHSDTRTRRHSIWNNHYSIRFYFISRFQSEILVFFFFLVFLFDFISETKKTKTDNIDLLCSNVIVVTPSRVLKSTTENRQNWEYQWKNKPKILNQTTMCDRVKASAKKRKKNNKNTKRNVQWLLWMDRHKKHFHLLSCNVNALDRTLATTVGGLILQATDYKRIAGNGTAKRTNICCIHFIGRNIFFCFLSA